MKISTRYTWMAFSSTGLAGLALVVTLVIWEFNTQRALWIAEVETRLAANPSWPVMLHYRTEDSAGRELALLGGQIAPVSFLSAYHVDGTRVALIPSDTSRPPRPERNRDTSLEVVSDFLSLADNTRSDDKHWSTALPLANYALTLSVPILSPVNPLDGQVSYDEYRNQLAAYEGSGARYVVGYIEAAVGIHDLLARMISTAVTIGISIGLVLLAAFVFIRSAVRSITKPLEQIAEVAHAIVAEDAPKNARLPVNRNDEIGEIATVLNGVIEGVHRIKAKHEVDRTLMSMRVDATSRKLSEAEKEVNATRSQIKKVAYYDPVTGLPNRRLLLEQLALLIQIAARERRYLGVILIDLENLRKINESLGRTAGDTVLRELSNRMIDTLRRSDLVSHDESPQDIARVGNDEFCVLLHGINHPRDAETAADRLLQALSKPMLVDDQQLQLKFFMGIALAPEHARDAEQLIRAADVALNDARGKGSHSPNIYSESMDQQGSERFQLEQDLSKADFNREFQLHYQPQINTDTGQLCGIEALVRWNHPTKGMIAPFKFISIAEETGDIVRLGNWILDRACLDLKEMSSAGLDIPKVSVNVSALQLTDDFIAEVAATLERHQLRPQQLELELTESLLVQSVDTVMARLNALRHDVGVRLSIDDFGTGYSSLAYLSRFPIDELKVDRSFVLAMEEDEAAAKVTGAIIAIAHQLDLDVVVEGVESAEQVALLQQHGAKIFQGYLFSKPVPRAELETLVSTDKLAQVIS